MSRYVKTEPIMWAEMKLEDRERLLPHLRTMIQTAQRLIEAYEKLPNDLKQEVRQLAKQAPSERTN